MFRIVSAALLLGCIALLLITSSNTEGNDQELAAAIQALQADTIANEERMALLYSKNEELQHELNQLKSQLDLSRESMAELDQGLERIVHIIYKLPIVERGLAYIVDVEMKDDQHYFVLDAVEWFSGVEAEAAAKQDDEPDAASLNNGYYIRNQMVERNRVQLPKDILIYTLDGSVAKYTAYENFVKSELASRLFHITSIEGQPILLEEKYRP
jgi:hypothetical protein